MLHREALRQRILFLGPDHINVGASLNNLAIIVMRKERYAEADSLFRASAAVIRSHFGYEHARMASNLNNRAYLQSQLGREAAAEMAAHGLQLIEYLFACEQGNPDLACPREPDPEIEPNAGFIGGALYFHAARQVWRDKQTFA